MAFAGTYPATRRDNVVDSYHGTVVADPYRWLENLDSEETRAWIEAQNQLTFSYLGRIPQRQSIIDRLTELWDYPKYSLPFKKGGRYFFSKNEGLQNQSVLYLQESLAHPPRVLLDPNTFSADGTVALSMVAVSQDGRLLAYGTSASGSDWQTFHVREVDSGRELADELRWIKFSGAAWTHDGAGFFYSRYPQPKEGPYQEANRNQQLYYHRLGTPQQEDELIYQRPDDPDLGFDPSVTHDGRYLILHVWKGTDRRNRLYYKDLQDPAGQIVRLLDDLDASYTLVGNLGTRFYLLTDLDAPRGRLIAIDIEQPARSCWQEVIPQGEAVISSVHFVNGHLVVRWLDHASSRLTLHSLAGERLKQIELPTLGTVEGISGDPDDPEMFYSFTSFIYPTALFRYDFSTGTSEVFYAPPINVAPSLYETRQLFYPSKDGTPIPLFLVHRRGLRRDGSHPTCLYGYGGFNVSLTPYFSVSTLMWLEMGGIYAVANLRGGGEYGEEWHQAGMLAHKQNVFDDFIAAAEYLIAEGYTSPARLAIEGGSNGGLLTGACLTQRPDLYGAVIIAVGVLDMLRYHRFTIGWAWVPEYGCADDPEQFGYLYAYSPLHNLKVGTHYPPTLITTSDHDDRVVPAHSFKFAAALQHAQAGPAPILIRIETKAGHGAGKPTRKVIEAEADKWAFLAYHLIGNSRP